jgi:hypothetical protein
MLANVRLVTIQLLAIAVFFSVGCGKQESAPQVSAGPALPGNWQTSMPAKFTGLAPKDGGACYLDAINGGIVGEVPVSVKSGSSLAMAGWAVADVKAGRIGSALGIQLNGPTPYFIAAEGYPRPGLSAALKSSSLDGGGLKLDPTPLNVPVGDYRIIFLAQSDNDLLRCDTLRTLHIE